MSQKELIIVEDTNVSAMLTQLTNVVTQLTALVSAVCPQASGVGVSTANMHYITEDDAQGALAELDAECFALNNSLTQKKMVTLLNDTHSVPTTTTSYELSDDIDNYDFLIFNFKRFSNLVNSAVFPVSYFKTTTSNGRIQIPLYLSDGSYVGMINAYYHNDTHVYLYSRNSTTATSDYFIAIYGVKA